MPKTSLYRSRLFEMQPDMGPKLPLQARGWRVLYRPMRVIDDGKSSPSEKAKAVHHMSAIIYSDPLPGENRRIVYAPELIIEARTRRMAQRAGNLIAAAKTLFDSDFTFGEAYTVVPDNPRILEDMNGADYDHAIHHSIGSYGFAEAAELAAKATRRRRWTLALVKYWLSLRTCSVAAMDLHPYYGDRFTVETDPTHHAIMAQAIIAAYSAIEELGLQVRASQQQPSKINGQWNPPVLANLKGRLNDAKIDIARSIVWHLRNSPTRIEKKHIPPEGQRAEWARYSVRDRNVQLVDAINYANLLRSKVSAHASHALTSSLTVYDVHNVQYLSRRLILETMGFWDRLVQGNRRQSAKMSRK